MSRFRLSGTLIWLPLLWLLLWSDASWANVVSGITVAIVVLAVSRLPRVIGDPDEDTTKLNPFAMVHLGGFILVKLVQANLAIAWEIMTPGSTLAVGVIDVQLRTDSPVSALVVANFVTLTPGTITIESTGSPAKLSVHVLQLHDPEAVRRDVLRIEELCVRAFGSRLARAQLSEQVAS